MSVQVSLDAAECETLQNVSERTGKPQGELLREALNLLAARYALEDRQARLRQASGLWRDRTDLPDWDAVRRELDRFE